MLILDVKYAIRKAELCKHIIITAEKAEAQDIGFLMEYACAIPAIREERYQHTKVRSGFVLRFLK